MFFLVISFSTMKTAHYRAKKDKSCRLFLVVVLMVTATAAAAVLVAVHYGSKQCDIETLNFTLSHELGSERSQQMSKRMSAS